MNIYGRENMETKSHILVVDDEPDNQDLLRDELEVEGYQVTIAENGDLALDILRKYPTRFEVILLDIMMPVMDGWETLAEMKQLPAVALIPVIFQTALTGDKEQQTGLKMGSYDYLTKPLDLEVLFDVVGNAVKAYKNAMRLRVGNTGLQFVVKSLLEAESLSRVLGRLIQIQFDSTVHENKALEALNFPATGFEALLFNAVTANVEIDRAAKLRLMTVGSFESELESRLEAQKYKSRSVTVSIYWERGQLYIRIRDQGVGFDSQFYVDAWEKVIKGDIDLDIFQRHKGCGIFTAFGVFEEAGGHVEYCIPGNEVRVSVPTNKQS